MTFYNFHNINFNHFNNNQFNFKQMATKTALNTKVIIPCRLSYAKIWTPGSYEGSDDKKYGVKLLIKKKEKDLIKKIKLAIENAKQFAKNKVWEGKIPKALKAEGLRDGDADDSEDKAAKGHFFINAASKTRPTIVKKVDGEIEPVTEQSEVYSGCYAAVEVNFYGYNWKGNKGITAGLNHILFLKDGEPLGGIGSATEAFADFDTDEFEDDEDSDDEDSDDDLFS